MCPGQEKGLNGPKFQTEKVKLTLAKAPVDDRQWMHLLSPIPQDAPSSTTSACPCPFAIPPSAHRGR